MSKLTNHFNKDEKSYEKRSKGTTASFPQLNPNALAQVYNTLYKDFNNQPLDDETLAQLAKSGNFNKLYSKFSMEDKSVIPTPERPEDVKGEWIEYNQKITKK